MAAMDVGCVTHGVPGAKFSLGLECKAAAAVNSGPARVTPPSPCPGFRCQPLHYGVAQVPGLPVAFTRPARERHSATRLRVVVKRVISTRSRWPVALHRF